MQTVGESVKNLYSDIVGDLLSPLSCDLDEKVDSELLKDQRTDAGFCKKPFQNLKQRPVKANTKQKAAGSRIDHNVANDVIRAASYDGTCETDAFYMSSSKNSVKGSNFITRSRQDVGSADIKSSLAIDENQVNTKMAATKISNEITLSETDRTSQCCEISNEDQNQNHGISVSKPAAEVTRPASDADHCDEIENASTEQFPNDLVLVKSAEEKQIDTSSSCGPIGEPVGECFSISR